ncbi:MAG: hypothetical protein EOO51_03045 [Flavobacterium sp.]|nr:MAG: hypothetical protein EOO51_03045 [Flavobacterium sp.]
MRKLAGFFLIFFLLTACNDNDAASQTPITDNSRLFDLSQLPEIQLKVSLQQWNKLLQNFDQNPKNEKKVVAGFSYLLNGQTITLDSIGLKLRGNTSRRRPEGSTGQMHNAAGADWHHAHFSIDFNKTRPNQLFNGLEKINLKWFKDDASYVREIYCYDLFKRFGVWTAPKASYCRLSIKVEGDAAPAYFGIYAMIESVDEKFIEARASHWNASPGYLWKGSNLGSDAADFVSTSSIGVEDVKLNPAQSQYFAYDLKTRKDELPSAKSQLIAFINDLNSKTGSDFQSWIATKMDVDLFLKTYATSVMLGMWDDYWMNKNNFYFYFASDGKAYFIPYDYDNTLGTSYLVPNSGTLDPLNWGPATGRPLVNKILAIPEYAQKYKQYVKELSNPQKELFQKTASIQRISAWQQLIAPYVTNDTGEDMTVTDTPASWGNAPFYRLLSGNASGGSNGNANYFSSRIATIPW